MIDLNARIQKAKKQITGNEALLDRLDADTATEILNWGISMVTVVANRTAAMDDDAAEQILAPGLKAVRGVMRSISNWAVGTYTDTTSRAFLKEKLMEQLNLIFGDRITISSATELEALLHMADDEKYSPRELIEKFLAALERSGQIG